jgi:uncharacterized protein (TIGR00297 family)
VHLLYDATWNAVAVRCGIGVIAAAIIAVSGYRVRALTASGAVAAVIVGTLTFAFGGLFIALAMLLFFASGSALGRIRTPGAEQARVRALKQGRRDAMQVLANGGVAAACAVAASVAGLLGRNPWPLLVGAMAALAAASGDTWSTEIGSLIGGRPRSLATMRPLEAGASGGVTALGTLAAPIGGAFVGLAALAPPANAAWFPLLSLAAVAGLAGSLVDSLAGATLQGLWRCTSCGNFIEAARHAQCRAPATLVRGWRGLDNDGVNLVATVCGASIGIALAIVIHVTP